MGAVHDVPVEGSEAGVGSGVWHSVTFVMVERSWDPCSWFMVHGSWFWVLERRRCYRTGYRTDCCDLLRVLLASIRARARAVPVPIIIDPRSRR